MNWELTSWKKKSRKSTLTVTIDGYFKSFNTNTPQAQKFWAKSVTGVAGVGRIFRTVEVFEVLLAGL